MPGPGAQLLAVPTDVSDEAACRALVAQSVQQFGGWTC
jgi:NAD(P)-dependent dehydrogenase (short-subunit alcohol dehydrogenase family)